MFVCRGRQVIHFLVVINGQQLFGMVLHFFGTAARRMSVD